MIPQLIHPSLHSQIIEPADSQQTAIRTLSQVPEAEPHCGEGSLRVGIKPQSLVTLISLPRGKCTDRQLERWVLSSALTICRYHRQPAHDAVSGFSVFGGGHIPLVRYLSLQVEQGHSHREPSIPSLIEPSVPGRAVTERAAKLGQVPSDTPIS